MHPICLLSAGVVGWSVHAALAHAANGKAWPALICAAAAAANLVVIARRLGGAR